MSKSSVPAPSAGATARPRVLVVVMGETRGAEITGKPFLDLVVDELGADLALCVGDREDENDLYQRAKYVWRLSEPDDWAELYNRKAGGPDWRCLLDLDENFLGGIQDPKFPTVGSGAIVLYFREYLKEKLESEGLLDSYDWFVVTRSDFLWQAPHVAVEQLSDDRLWFLDGDRFGGLPDRHFVIPQHFMRGFLECTAPIFSDPKGLRESLGEEMFVDGQGLLNVEMFLAWRLRALGLGNRIGYLPYVAFTVRPAEGTTRWAAGEFDDELGFFVKYPSEQQRAYASAPFVKDQQSWERFLSPVRGLTSRLRVRWECRDLWINEQLSLARPRLGRPWRRLLVRLGRAPGKS